MAGLGLVGAYGAQGADDALQQMIKEKLTQEATARAIQQQQIENQQKDRQIGVQEAGVKSLAQDRTDRLAESEKNARITGALRTTALLKPGSMVSPTDYANANEAGVGSLYQEKPPQLPSTQYQGAPSMMGMTGGAIRTVSNPAKPGGYQFQGTQADDQKQAEMDAKTRAFTEQQHEADLRNQIQQGQLGVAQANSETARARAEAAQAAADAKANAGPKPITMSAQGKSALAAIETAGPLTDQVLQMILKQAPDIETNPGKYNTLGAKAGSLYQVAKYKAGFYDQNDPRQQLVSLLQPIQAGQYTRSSRSRQMLELALKHMADPSQTLLTQYQRAKELKGIMPEMREGVIRGEQPIDPANPMAGSYFDPKGGGSTAPVAMIAPDGRPLSVPPEKVAEMEAAGAKRK